MQIGQAVFEALMLNQEILFSVVADWIEDHKRDHPEAGLYIKRLRTKGLRIRSVIDVVCKFGSRGERKLYNRINRIILEMRHRPEKPIPTIDDVFSMENRRKINRFLKAGTGDRARKKPILASTRKRTVLNNDVWYVKALKSLLSKHYPMVGGGSDTSS